MGNFILAVLNLMRISIICVIAYVGYTAFTSISASADRSSNEASQRKQAQLDRDASLQSKELATYGRVMSSEDRVLNAVEGSMRDKAKALNELGKTLNLRPPPEDRELDVAILDTETAIQESAGNFKNWLYLIVYDPLLHRSMETTVIGRVSIPEWSSLPMGFSSKKPVAFMVGTQTDTKPITSKIYMIADCTVTDQTKPHNGWFADPTENFKWSPLYSSLTNFNYAVAHQACWMAYPDFPVQTIIDTE